MRPENAKRPKALNFHENVKKKQKTITPVIFEEKQLPRVRFGTPRRGLKTHPSPRSRVVVRAIAGKGENGTPPEGPNRAPKARF